MKQSETCKDTEMNTESHARDGAGWISLFFSSPSLFVYCLSCLNINRVCKKKKRIFFVGEWGGELREAGWKHG